MRQDLSSFVVFNLMASLKQKVVKGTFWILLEQFSTQFVGFVIGMVLARLLTPTDYGTVSMISIFTAIALVLTDSGFTNALVQKKNATDLDFNSVFYCCLVLSGIAYLVLFFLSPYVAVWLDTPVLKGILRVMALTLFFHAVNGVQNAELSRKMLFHLSFRINLISVIVGTGTGLTLAFLGYGPWALVWQSIASGVSGVISRWFFIAWRPKLQFSFHALGGLFGYSWKLTLSSLLDSGYRNLFSLMVGKFYSKADLAFLHKGSHTPKFIMSAVNGTLGRVMFPALAQMQDDPDRLREAMRRMIQCSTFLVFPMLTGMAFLAPSLIPLLYGEKWLPAIPFMQVACFSLSLWPFHTINLQGIKAMGRSDLFLGLEIAKKILCFTLLGVFFLFFQKRCGVIVYAMISAFTLGPLGVLINSWPNRKLMGYSLWDQLKDVTQPFLLCLPMALAMYFVGKIPLFEGVRVWRIPVDLMAHILLQMVTGTIVFLVSAFTLKPRPLREYARIAGPALLKKAPACILPLVRSTLKKIES